jgi:cytochrome c oxidase subunit 2
MSKLFASIAAGAAFFTTAAWADQPHPWQWRFQEAASPIMEQIEWFERYTLWFIVPITLFVLALLGYCILKFRESVNPTPSRTSHNTIIEIVWTVAPSSFSDDRHTVLPVADGPVYAR